MVGPQAHEYCRRSPREARHSPIKGMTGPSLFGTIGVTQPVVDGRLDRLSGAVGGGDPGRGIRRFLGADQTTVETCRLRFRESTVRPSSDDSDLVQIVAEARAGTNSAWEILIERFGGLVAAIARRCRLSDADVGEVCQTTWLRLVENLDRIEQPERLGAWLATTAAARAKDRHPAHHGLRHGCGVPDG